MAISSDLFRANVAAAVSGLGDPFLSAGVGLAQPGDLLPGAVVLSTAAIRLDGGAQMRAGLDPQTIRAYADRYLDGDRFPSLSVVYDGLSYWLADGFHRLAALGLLANETSDPRWLSVSCEVTAGDKRAAVLLAAGANGRHGLPRKIEDKRRAALALLTDPEWALWSDNEIARACVVSQPFVSKLRREMAAAAGAPALTVRRGADGRSIHVGAIGSGPAAGKPAAAVAWAPGSADEHATAPALEDPQAGRVGWGPAAQAERAAALRWADPVKPVAAAASALTWDQPGKPATAAATATAAPIPLRSAYAAPVVVADDLRAALSSDLPGALAQVVDLCRVGLFADKRGAALALLLSPSQTSEIKTAAAVLALAAESALATINRMAAAAGLADGGE